MTQVKFIFSCFSPFAFANLRQLVGLCHPGLDPGTRARNSQLQRAALKNGSRVFARDDKERSSPGMTKKGLRSG
jgi:hypothetical protein